jgi:hypothetical protein
MLRAVADTHAIIWHLLADPRHPPLPGPPSRKPLPVATWSPFPPSTWPKSSTSPKKPASRRRPSIALPSARSTAVTLPTDPTASSPPPNSASLALHLGLPLISRDRQIQLSGIRTIRQGPTSPTAPSVVSDLRGLALVHRLNRGNGSQTRPPHPRPPCNKKPAHRVSRRAGASPPTSAPCASSRPGHRLRIPIRLACIHAARLSLGLCLPHTISRTYRQRRLPQRQLGCSQGLLCTWAICRDGRKVMLHLELGSRASDETCLAFIRILRR